METALYLLPVTLGDTSIEKVLPSYNKEIISGIRYFIVEDVRSARRFLKKVDREIDIDALTFYPLNKICGFYAINKNWKIETNMNYLVTGCSRGVGLKICEVLLRQGQVRKFCSVGGDVHKVSIQFASISKVIYIFADTLL